MQLADGIQIDAYGCTDQGRVRRNNQDQFLIAELHKVFDITHTSIPSQFRQRFESGARALMLLVADGVGGMSGGEEASALTMDTVVTYVSTSMRCFYKLDEHVQQELMSELSRIVQESDAAVRSKAESSEQSRMATTLTMAHVLWPRAYVVQIGDSRCYHVHGDSMMQITKDQTMAQAMIEKGILDPAHADRSPFNDMLTQAIGTGDVELTAEISTVQLEVGDSLLLCTDGLTKHVGDEAIRDALCDTTSAEDTAQGLLKQALDDGGSDNTTIVVARFS